MNSINYNNDPSITYPNEQCIFDEERIEWWMEIWVNFSSFFAPPILHVRAVPVVCAAAVSSLLITLCAKCTRIIESH